MGLGILFRGVGVWYLGRRAYELAREMLDAGVRLGKTEKLISFKPVLLLLPLLVHYHNSSVDRLLDGTTVSRSYGYGTNAGWVPFLLGTVLFLLFQIVMKLERARVSDGTQVVRATLAHATGTDALRVVSARKRKKRLSVSPASLTDERVPAAE